MNGPPDATTVGAAVEAALRDRGVAAPRCRQVIVVDDKPGRRAVLRAELVEPVELPGRPGSPLAAVYVKWSADTGRGERNHATLDALEQALGAVAGGPWLPAAIAHLPGLSLQLLGEVAGATVAQHGPVLDGASAEVLGRALATFHHSGAALPAAYHLDDEARTLREWVTELVGAGCPAGLVARYREVTDEAVAATAAVPLWAGGVVHRDLHEEHCLLTAPAEAGTGPGVGVIDLDEVRQGDPVVDLGHLAVHLHLRAGATGAGLYRGPAGAVLAAWDRAAPEPSRPEAVRAFGALACVKIARQRATGYGTAPRPVGAARWPSVAAALELAESLLR